MLIMSLLPGDVCLLALAFTDTAAAEYKVALDKEVATIAKRLPPNTA